MRMRNLIEIMKIFRVEGRLGWKRGFKVLKIDLYEQKNWFVYKHIDENLSFVMRIKNLKSLYKVLEHKGVSW